MSKQVEGVRRMLLILAKLRMAKSCVSKEELHEYVNSRISERYGYMPVTWRTIERDICDIGELFHIEIKYSRSRCGYQINANSGLYEEQVNELMMNFDLLNAVDGDSDLSSYVLAENHRPAYSQWLMPLMNAIKETCRVSFDYVFYRHGNAEKTYTVCPHYLKESNQRWYLLAYDGCVLKTFGVDRIRNLNLLQEETFERDTSIDVEAMFRDCYGIWNDENLPVEDIELRYDARDGAFVKSVPIHHSQIVLAETPEEVRISLRLRITNDFVMELLSRSRSLEVIAPAHLRERVRKVYEEALKRNS